MDDHGMVHSPLATRHLPLAMCLLVWVCALAGCAGLSRHSPREELAAAGGSRLEMAQLSEKLGRDDLAERHYRAYIKDHPDSRQAHHRLGVLASRVGRYAEADRRFKLAARLGGVEPELLNDVAYSLYQRKRLVNAQRVLEMALAKEPDNGKSRAMLALVLTEQGRMREGMAQFKQALRAGERNGDPLAAFATLGPEALARDHEMQAARRTRDALAAAGVRPARPDSIEPRMPPPSAIAAAGRPPQDRRPKKRSHDVEMRTGPGPVHLAVARRRANAPRLLPAVPLEADECPTAAAANVMPLPSTASTKKPAADKAPSSSQKTIRLPLVQRGPRPPAPSFKRPPVARFRNVAGPATEPQDAPAQPAAPAAAETIRVMPPLPLAAPEAECKSELFEPRGRAGVSTMMFKPKRQIPVLPALGAETPGKSGQSPKEAVDYRLSAPPDSWPHDLPLRR